MLHLIKLFAPACKLTVAVLAIINQLLRFLWLSPLLVPDSMLGVFLSLYKLIV
jgi:hypothetical protein